MSLEELLVRVTELVESYGLHQAQQDNRVAALPDIRTIRYYTTLGLLDRPLIEGRQGRYQRRHLLQLVAVKALQTLSLPLSEIQAKLFGLSELELEAVIEAVAGEVRAKTGATSSIRPVVWREVVIEPGLKIMAEEMWTRSVDDKTLEERIKAALRIL
ncbi:MAG TPA: MerR family transcriptional regulator [Candidatus Obscuribacterales bacterium]